MLPKMQVFWDVTSCRLVVTDVSKDRNASVFMVDLTSIFRSYGVRNVTTSVRRNTEHDVFCDPVPQQYALTLTCHRTPDSSLGMVTVLRTSVRLPSDTGYFLFSTASRYNVGATQISSPGLVNYKPQGGRNSICAH